MSTPTTQRAGSASIVSVNRPEREAGTRRWRTVSKPGFTPNLTAAAAGLDIEVFIVCAPSCNLLMELKLITKSEEVEGQEGNEGESKVLRSRVWS